MISRGIALLDSLREKLEMNFKRASALGRSTEAVPGQHFVSHSAFIRKFTHITLIIYLNLSMDYMILFLSAVANFL